MTDILQAMASPSLFAGMFDAPSWRPWKAFLRALVALPLDDDDFALYRHHTGRQESPKEPFREATLICGRRGGKSRVLALLGIYFATVPDYTAYIAPGETPVVAIIAADRKQARVILGYVAGLLHAAPALEEMIADELAESVTLTNGVVIEIHTGSIGAPRGRTFIAVLADEIAFWVTDVGAANPDREIISAVRPGLSTIPTSVLLKASSPYAKRGVLYEDFSRYYGKDGAPVLVWRGTTREMNSRIDPRFIEEAYEADPEAAAAEYGAEFRTDITAFIGREAVEAVVARGIIELPPSPGIIYSAFCDPSGGSADSMTLAIGHMASDGVALLDAVRERKPPFSPEDVVSEFCGLLCGYGITRVSGDAYAGEWPRERFAVHGITYEVAGRNKNAIYGDFLPALNGQRVRLLDHARLVAQLCGLDRRVSRGGKDSIDHAPGQHDDIANAACGVLTGLIDDRRPALIRPSDMLVDDRPVSTPPWAQTVFATLVVGDDGQTGVAWFAHHDLPGIVDPAPLILLDFDLAPLAADTVRAMFARLEEFGGAIRNVKIRSAWVPAALRDHVQQEGYSCEAFPEQFLADLSGIAVAAAGHVRSGLFKISETAMMRAAQLPLAGALNFRAGEAVEKDPLRLAILFGITLGLAREN